MTPATEKLITLFYFNKPTSKVGRFLGLVYQPATKSGRNLTLILYLILRGCLLHVYIMFKYMSLCVINMTLFRRVRIHTYNKGVKKSIAFHGSQ